MTISVVSASFLHLLRLPPSDAAALAGVSRATVQRFSTQQTRISFPFCVDENERAALIEVARNMVPAAFHFFEVFPELEKKIKSGVKLSRALKAMDLYKSGPDREKSIRLYLHLSRFSHSRRTLYQTCALILSGIEPPHVVSLQTAAAAVAPVAPAERSEVSTSSHRDRLTAFLDCHNLPQLPPALMDWVEQAPGAQMPRGVIAFAANKLFGEQQIRANGTTAGRLVSALMHMGVPNELLRKAFVPDEATGKKILEILADRQNGKR